MNQKWNLKIIVKEILSTLVLFFIISLIVNYIRKPDIKEDIYALEIDDINNQKINFHSYKGRPLLVHFWATWCPTCKFEAANIQNLSASFQVLSIAVNSGTNEKLQAYMKSHDFNYTVINDSNGALAKRFNIGAYPTTLIYSGTGELKFTEVGYSTTLGLKGRLKLLD